MAHYFLYLPGKPDAKRADLASFGVAELLDVGDSDPHFFPVAGSGGPDGGSGALCQLQKELDPEKQSSNPAPGYLPERQTWRQSLDGKYWLGWETANPPTEAELARNRQLTGRAAVLVPAKDGQPAELFVIPNTFAQLARMKKNADGKWEPSAEYIHDDLQAKAAPMMVMLEETIERQVLLEQAGEDEQCIPPDTWDDNAALDFVAELLAINYRVNDFILGELGLLIQERAPLIIGLATDYERLSRLETELRSGK